MSNVNVDIKTSENETIREEIEKVFLFRVYAKIKSLDILADAEPSSVETVQFFFLEDEEDSETQLILNNINDSKYELTHRRIKEGEFTNYVDVVNPISESMFTQLRKRAKIGYKILLYKFPLLDDPERCWEVMVFWGNDGQIHPWVSCSCMYTETEPRLPFETLACIVENDPYNDEEIKEFIDELWVKSYAKIDERDIAEV